MTEVTGPLLRLERDADPGDLKFPHRLIWNGVLAWLTDAEAADFEARYWTGDLPRPTPPAARVLPEGVHEAPDGTLLWKCERDGFKAYPERVTPPGYAAWLGIDNVSQGAMPGRWYEVRPIPDPEPEPVPHTESIGRVTTESPYPVTSYHGHADGGRWVLCDSVNADGVKNGWDRVNADSSGMVSCLPITDGDGQ